MSGLMLVAVVALTSSLMASSVLGRCPLQCLCLTACCADCINSSLTELPETGFNQDLTKLNASFNDITVLNKTSLKHIPLLTHLNLSHNKITDINSQAFLTLKSLSYLDLSSNNIITIVPDTFMYNKKFLWLSLADNSMLTLPSTLFLSQLQFLNLSRCNLRNLTSDFFKNMQELHQLYLDNNEIVSLKTGVFRQLYRLQKLDLCHNALENLHVHDFGRLRDLRSLSLCHNNFIRINATLVDAFIRIGAVDLEGNPWICDCDSADVYYKCIRNKSCHLNVTCEFPDNLKQRHWNVIDQLGCVTSASPTTIKTSSVTEGFTAIHQTTAEIDKLGQSSKKGVWFCFTVVFAVICILMFVAVLVVSIKICRRCRKNETKELDDGGSTSSSGGFKCRCERDSPQIEMAEVQ